MGERDKQICQTVVTFLTRDEMDFLDKLGKDAFFSTGSKVSRTKLIAWLVDILKSLPITGQNITCGKDLESKVKEALMLIEKKGEGNEYKKH